MQVCEKILKPDTRLKSR